MPIVANCAGVLVKTANPAESSVIRRTLALGSKLTTDGGGQGQGKHGYAYSRS